VKGEVIPCNLANVEHVQGIFQKALHVMEGRIDILMNRGEILKTKGSLLEFGEQLDSVRTILMTLSFVSGD